MASTDNRPVVAPLDFDTIKNDMIAYFRSRPEFKDYNFTGSALNQLLDILAYNTHYNSLAANFLVNEMFLDTAVLRDNVVSIAKLLNYIPRSSRAATTKVQMQFRRPDPDTPFVVLPAGFQFQARLGSNTIYNFQTLQDYIIQFRQDSENLTVDVYEGMPITQRFVAGPVTDQTTFPAFDLLSTNIDTTTIAVTVNGVKFSQVTAVNEGITTVNAQSPIFFVEETAGQLYRIILGNGVIGQRPNPGDEILVTYLVTKGPEANGISLLVPASTAPGFTQTSWVLNQTMFGALPETIREIKSNAAHWFQAQYRAVTAADYETVLRQLYPDIQAINVYGGETVGTPGRVYIAIKPRTADVLSDVAKQTISRDILSKYNLVTVTPTLVDPDIIRIVVKTVVQYDPAVSPLDPTILRTSIFNLFETFNTEYIGNFLRTFYVSTLASVISDLDPSIVSVNSRISLQFNVTADSDQLLDRLEWSFNNRLYHPFDGYNASNGGILTTNLFNRAGKSFLSGFDDDGYGNIRLFDYIDNERVYVSEIAGSVDYTTGAIQLRQFDPGPGVINFTVIPDSFDVIANDNIILQISGEDSVVYVVDRNDYTTLKQLSASRSA